MRITLNIGGDPRISLKEDAQTSVKVADVNSSPPYKGSYSVTPTTSEQVLLTGGTHLSDHIRVAPIPSNYGLIGWNGSVITVS